MTVTKSDSEAKRKCFFFSSVHLLTAVKVPDALLDVRHVWNIRNALTNGGRSLKNILNIPPEKYP